MRQRSSRFTAPTRRGTELAHDIRHTDCGLVVTEAANRPLLDGLDLLTPDGTPGASAPGLYFTGFADPADGTLRHLSRTATRTAKALPRDRSRRLRSRPSN